VAGCTPEFWKHVDTLMEIAQRRQVYILATLMSFDHFSERHAAAARWRKMLTSTNNIDSLVRNYVARFADRYKENPWLFAIDLCNEPDWIHENPTCGQLPWSDIQEYVARAAAAIHARSPVLVTLGICMGPKYISPTLRTHIATDEILRATAGGDPAARLDFYAPHHYNWMTSSFKNPFYISPEAYGLDNTRPTLFGECPARGTAAHTIVDDYESAWRNGWQGVMGWTSNDIDANGGLKELGPGTRAFRDRHPDLVFPGVGVPAAPAPAR
jgi:hypothetical protein